MASIPAITAAASRSRRTLSVRVVSSVAFTVCFMLWMTFGALKDPMGERSSAFMLPFGVIWVALILMYLAEVRPRRMQGPGAA